MRDIENSQGRRRSAQPGGYQAEESRTQPDDPLKLNIKPSALAIHSGISGQCTGRLHCDMGTNAEIHTTRFAPFDYLNNAAVGSIWPPAPLKLGHREAQHVYEFVEAEN